MKALEVHLQEFLLLYFTLDSRSVETRALNGWDLGNKKCTFLFPRS